MYIHMYTCMYIYIYIYIWYMKNHQLHLMRILRVRAQEKRFSYAQLPPWVPTAAAVARLWRLQKPFPPTRSAGKSRRWHGSNWGDP